VGKLALALPQEPDSARRAFVASQLPLKAWPEKPVLICAVNAETGERRVFDKNSGVDLLDAVMASGAVAGIWPPVLIAGQPYMDGGFYSTESADLAAGFERVLVLALRAARPPLSVVSLEAAVEKLRSSGARVEVVHPDKATESAIAFAGGILNPAVRAPAVKAGREQGRRLATELRAFWA
jgi:NTE family protein